MEIGSIKNLRIWYHLSTADSTSQENYVDFLNYDLLDKFEDGEEQRTIIHDNLSSHKSTKMYDAIYSRGHHVICGPSYGPNEAPTYWVGVQLGCIRDWEEEMGGTKDKDDLDTKIHNILEFRVGLSGFNKSLIDCSYEFYG